MEVKVWTEPMDGMVNYDLFDAMKSYAGKADVMRLEILLQHGGMYCDVDARMISKLPVEHDLICMTSASGYIGNETICAVEMHPALFEAVVGLRRHIEGMIIKGDPCNIWDIAGATYITPIFEKHYHVKLTKEYIGPRSLSPKCIVHSYDYSWRDKVRPSKSLKRPIEEWIDLSKLRKL
jgi:mannosyltransferase OCH1-like enzyme